MNVPTHMPRGALIGTAIGLNAWLVALGISLLTIDGEAPSWSGYWTLVALNIPLTVLVLTFTAMARRALSQKAFLCALFGILGFAIGVLLLAFESTVGPSLARDEGFAEVMAGLGAVTQVPRFVAPTILAISSVPLYFALRATLRTRS
ncbi:MAG: hypothetical protein H6832_07965 [Planctomycetes bacterium]|nr:hypothetical protein [Planctomycetota bacterium]MCB9918325.1 hypothetical protein [Planctomycetota bacterium]